MLHLIALDTYTPHVYLSCNVFVFNYDTLRTIGADIYRYIDCKR